MRSVGAILVALALGASPVPQTISTSSSLAGIVLNDERAPVACARVVLRGRRTDPLDTNGP